MAVDSVGSASAAAQLQALRQVPQQEQQLEAAVAAPSTVDPKQTGVEQGTTDPSSKDPVRQAVTAAHLGAIVDEEA